MKNIKYVMLFFLALTLVMSCEEESYEFGDITAPTNLEVTAEIVGQDADNPYGDGSGVVNFTATADNVITYKYISGDVEEMAPLGTTTLSFSTQGVHEYTVTVVAIGTAGVSTSTTIVVEVLTNYSPPQELVDQLVGTDSTPKVWRLKSEASGHFGLGPVGGTIPCEWYGAGPDEKVGVGMYDDRFIFGADGTFTHITNYTNDDTSGTIFGRVGLVSELAEGGTPNGSDVENVPYSDYTENYVITAPGGVETINISGLGFISYYIGNHSYEIFDRSVPNELTLKVTDGNNEFDWWFILTSEEESVADDYSLIWSDEFDVNGAPDAANWTFDLGTGTNGWGNNELQTYTDNSENVIVEDGVLKITAKADGSGGYTSARIKSEGLQEFMYGKIEIRAKLPASEGTWPALWMLGANYSTVGWPTCGEIDIMEQVGSDKSRTLGTFHWFDSGTNAAASYGDTMDVADTATEFHVYSMEWSEETIEIFVDDVSLVTIANNPDLPFNSDFFFIMNIAMGGTLGGTVDPDFTEDSMEIDYIRVYQ